MTQRPDVTLHRCRYRLGRLAALLLLAGCTVPKSPSEPAVQEPVAIPPVEEQSSLLRNYTIKPGIGRQCVPYARSRTGISLYGDAYTWWDTATGHYARGRQPKVGSVFVLNKSDRLRHGHVGVVSAVMGPREIRVDHANWQPNAVIINMAVMDVSPANDWTQLRFWNKNARMWGAVYPASGFIYSAAEGAVPERDVTIVSGSRATISVPPQETTP